MGAGDQLGAVGADVMAGWVGGGEMRHGSRIHGLGVGRVCRQAGPRGSGLQHMGAQWLPGLVCEGLTERPPGAVPREVTCGACGGKPWTRGVVLMLSFLCGVRASPDSPPCPPSVPWTPPPPSHGPCSSPGKLPPRLQPAPQPLDSTLGLERTPGPRCRELSQHSGT